MTISKDTVERLTLGDRDTYHSVFKKAYPKVYSFAFGFLKNREDAEDIAQTVFIRLWTKRTNLEGIDNLDAYLYVMTKNCVLNFLSQRKVYITDISEMYNTIANTASPEEIIEERDLKLLIDMVVGNMPSQRQSVYRMSREERLTNEEIAQRMGLQKKTIENHLNLALKDIRGAMMFLFFILTNWG